MTTLLIFSLVPEVVPDAPTDIWNDALDLPFWTRFEAHAHSAEQLRRLREAYEESGLASFELPCRVYQDIAWAQWEPAGNEAVVKEEASAYD